MTPESASQGRIGRQAGTQAGRAGTQAGGREGRREGGREKRRKKKSSRDTQQEVCLRCRRQSRLSRRSSRLAPRSSRLRLRLRSEAQCRLAQWPTGPHPDPPAGLVRAHGQTARRSSGRAEKAETRARARSFAHERERTLIGAPALACARASTVRTTMDECYR